MATFSSVFNWIVETPDPARPGQTIRPPAGTQIPARDYATRADLPPVVVDEYGHWSASYDSSAIELRPDPSGPWRGPVLSVEILAGLAAG